MLQKIWLWALRLLARRLDADLDAEIKLYESRRQSLDTEIANHKQVIAELEKQQTEISAQRISLHLEIEAGVQLVEALKTKLEKINEEHKSTQFEIAHRSDSDVLRGTL